jgi:tetrahydromethanopterin S-methyltransferase subunit G
MISSRQDLEERLDFVPTKLAARIGARVLRTRLGGIDVDHPFDRVLD